MPVILISLISSLAILKANVICHFPLISDIDFIHSIDGDETLYDMIMTQFYMKVFNGLLLFCRSHYASHLLIYMDDPTVGNRAGFNNFLMSKRHIEPLQHNAHEQYVPINQQLYDDWQEYMLDTDLKFKQLLWQRQRSSASIKNYLHDHPFG